MSRRTTKQRRAARRRDEAVARALMLKVSWRGPDGILRCGVVSAEAARLDIRWPERLGWVRDALTFGWVRSVDFDALPLPSEPFVMEGIL